MGNEWVYLIPDGAEFKYVIVNSKSGTTRCIYDIFYLYKGPAFPDAFVVLERDNVTVCNGHYETDGLVCAMQRGSLINGLTLHQWKMQAQIPEEDSISEINSIL